MAPVQLRSAHVRIRENVSRGKADCPPPLILLLLHAPLGSDPNNVVRSERLRLSSASSRETMDLRCCFCRAKPDGRSDCSRRMLGRNPASLLQCSALLPAGSARFSALFPLLVVCLNHSDLGSLVFLKHLELQWGSWQPEWAGPSPLREFFHICCC